MQNLFKEITEEMQLCIQKCMQCYQVCEQTVHHLMQAEHPQFQRIQTLMTCSEPAKTTATLLMSNSYIKTEICHLCAEAAMTAGAACEGDDPILVICARTCFQCVDSCRVVEQTAADLPS